MAIGTIAAPAPATMASRMDNGEDNRSAEAAMPGDQIEMGDCGKIHFRSSFETGCRDISSCAVGAVVTTIVHHPHDRISEGASMQSTGNTILSYSRKKPRLQRTA